ncbi:uncharacterized protein LOC131650303 [Vicia villosa]|uniref:uncharacterized protein LOC131650303 n=1 Tax=Vicia villosa TaxID=3911 RepID=UPI00273C9098|nr:uncharacterized protein LOC131650303 [Vicia villosa]
MFYSCRRRCQRSRSYTTLQHHHVPCPSLCPWCDCEDEDDWHVFFGCASTSQSWWAAGLSSLIDSRLQSFHDAKSLIFDVCSREDRRDAGRFAVMLEVLWRSRNNVVWQDVREDAIRIGLQAYHNWYDWFIAIEEHAMGDNNNNLVAWSPPMINQLKCNVDAGFNNVRGTTNRGWCFRDHLGRFIRAGVAWGVGLFSVHEAEAMALKEAIQHAISSHFSYVVFESDCQLVVNSIKAKHVGYSEFSFIIKSIQNLLCCFPNFEMLNCCTNDNAACELVILMPLSLCYFFLTSQFINRCVTSVFAASYSTGVTIQFKNEEECEAFHSVVQQWIKKANVQGAPL